MLGIRFYLLFLHPIWVKPAAKKSHFTIVNSLLPKLQEIIKSLGKKKKKNDEEIILPSALRVGMCQNCDRNYESKCLEHRTLELRDLVLDANYNKSSVCINFGNLGTSSLLDCNCPMTFGYSWKLSKFFDLPGKISVLALSSFFYFDSLCYLEKKLTCNSPEICSDAMRPELVANYDATNHFIARYGFIHDLRVNSIMTALFSLNCINTSSQKVNLMLYNKIYFLPTFYTERKKKR